MTKFCDDVGWDIMWDFNLFFWKDGLWDTTDANKLLKYSQARGVRMPSFQLGNGKLCKVSLLFCFAVLRN